MCCFKRLAVKMKRKAGWDRKEKAPSVTRQSQSQINQRKEKAMRTSERKERRKSADEAKKEAINRNQFFQQKGWAT